MISQVQDLYQLIYNKLVNKETIEPSLLTRLHTQIFLQNIEKNLELEEFYYDILRKHIQSHDSISPEQLEILVDIVYYLGIFINQQSLFTKAFQIIKENLIDNQPIIQNSLYLNILQACGSQNICLKQGHQFLNIDINNNYFKSRFLTPYLDSITQRIPKDNIIQFIQNEQYQIKLLHPESENYIIYNLKFFIIQQQLKTVDFKTNSQELLDLFTFLQIEDKYKYKLKQKLSNLEDKDNSINSFYQLAIKYKEFLSQYLDLDFDKFFQQFKVQLNNLQNFYQNEKHMLIVLNETIEEYLLKHDCLQNLLETQDENIGYFSKCMIQSIDHFVNLMMEKLFKLVSPYRSNFNLSLQSAKINKMSQYHQKLVDKYKLKELEKYLKIAQNSIRPLYLPYPQFISQTAEIISNIPNQLLQYLPKEQKKIYQLSAYGYAEVTYKQNYTLVLNTKQLVSLYHLINNNLKQIDQINFNLFKKLGLINAEGSINNDWQPTHKCLILFN
ncbi:unnamed protein product [Paramecium pentaurelia]|uniref:Uncharacterized protein n=1 Tax=Paramecium pentaurelia TaxID=43138 RepID=A0A8S1VS70_9CILI|nr:unnamed protein product [Paramecium pentaurelia]